MNGLLGIRLNLRILTIYKVIIQLWESENEQKKTKEKKNRLSFQEANNFH